MTNKLTFSMSTVYLNPYCSKLSYTPEENNAKYSYSENITEIKISYLKGINCGINGIEFLAA